MTLRFTSRREVADDRQAVEKVLAALLPAATTDPARLHEAMHYALFAGGKRLRPLLVLAACRACGGEDRQALAAAAAIRTASASTRSASCSACSSLSWRW